MIFIRIICEKYGAFFDLSSFLSDRSDDSNDFNSENTFPEEEPFRNVVSESVNKVVGLQISKKLTLDATSKVLNLMNSMPEANIKLPEDPRAIKSYSHQQINYKFFLKCTQCDELVEDKTNFLAIYQLGLVYRISLDQMENSLARIVNTLEIQSKTNLVELQYDMYSMSQQRICFGSIQDFRLWAYYRRVL